VKDLPPPTAFVAGKSSKDGQVRKPEFTAAQGVTARLIDSEWGDPWQVQRFQLTIVRTGAPPVYLPSTSNAFTPEMRVAMHAIRPGDKVYIEQIKAKLANGQTNPRDLDPIALKIIP